jgi:hypothetical protein
MAIKHQQIRRLDSAHIEVASLDEETNICCRRLVSEDLVGVERQRAIECAKIENTNAIERFISDGGARCSLT